MLFVGCNSEHLKKIQRNEVLTKCDDLVQGYLSQNVEGARHCLHQQADLLEQSTILEPIGRSGILALTYARLYVLDTRDGKMPEAEADMLKAKFWILKCDELRNKSPGDAMKEIQENNTPENVIAGVDEQDKGINNGNLPVYVNSVHLTNSSVKKN